MTVSMKMLVPTANTATAYQDVSGGAFGYDKVVNERWTLSGFLDHTEAAIINQGWIWDFKVQATGSAGQGTYSGLLNMFQQTAVTGGSANLVQLIWTDPSLNQAVTSTAYFKKFRIQEWLDPYNLIVNTEFQKYFGP